ncbi:meiosis-specific nuclear structural protein 1-like [Oscarella lobularis]|uniref:meiosis-specific nuclear structural protein 1-like n=1 Tax=Oscarella lobularis TaxID=121494 RepID=UPI0033132DE0
MSRTIRKEREGENCVGTRGGCAAVGGPMCFGVSACAADDSTALCGRCRREWSCLDTRAADGHTSNFARERNNGTNILTPSSRRRRVGAATSTSLKSNLSIFSKEFDSQVRYRSNAPGSSECASASSKQTTSFLPMATGRRFHLSHAQEERRRADNRRREYVIEDHMRTLAKDRMLRANMSSDERVENKRLLRQMQQEQSEIGLERSIIEAEKARVLQEKQRVQEEALAREMDKLKWEKEKDIRMRQQIQENSLELRELKAKLKAGYMNRERAAQLAEKRAMMIDKEREERDLTETMRSEHQKSKRAEEEKEKKRWDESVRYQQELEKQLDEQERKRQEAYEEFLKEKLMIDEIVRKIYEEDQREIERKLTQQKATQRYIEDFLGAREEWKKREREEMEKENQKILEFAKERQMREEERMAQKKVQEEAKASVQNQLAQEIAKKREEEEEMERIRTELYLEEQEERERQKEKMDIERQIRRRIDLQKAHAIQMRIKEERERALRDEEQRFREEMMRKFAEDDRIEQMNAQKRRMKQLEHKRAVERLIEQRRAQHLRDKEAEVEERREEERLEGLRREIIEQERRKLLREHAAQLLGYLPKGVLRGSQDLDMFDDEFKKRYERTKRDDFDDF